MYFILLVSVHLYAGSCSVFNISCATVSLNIVFEPGGPFSTTDLHLPVTDASAASVTVPSYDGFLGILIMRCGINVHVSSSRHLPSRQIFSVFYAAMFKASTV